MLAVLGFGERPDDVPRPQEYIPGERLYNWLIRLGIGQKYDQNREKQKESNTVEQICLDHFLNPLDKIELPPYCRQRSQQTMILNASSTNYTELYRKGDDI